jgi:hypothetical protein
LVDQTSLSKHRLFYTVNRGEKLLKKQRNCKICNAEEWLRDYFVLAYHVEHLTYYEICEVFARHGYEINFYNVNVHVQRHLTNEDFHKAEATKARWEKIKAQLTTS